MENWKYFFTHVTDLSGYDGAFTPGQLWFIPIWLMYYLGNFGGFSLGKNLALFLIGYYVLSNAAVTGSIIISFD